MKGMAGTTPFDEPPPNKSEGGLPALPLKHEQSQFSAIIGDNQIHQDVPKEIVSNNLLPGSGVFKGGKLCFIARELKKDEVRQRDEIVARRHLNMHHKLRMTFGYGCHA